MRFWPLGALVSAKAARRSSICPASFAPSGQKRKECPQSVASNAKMLRLQGEDHLPSAGQKRKERPQSVAGNAKLLRLQGEGHLPSAGDKYMKRLESANTTGTRADLAESHLGNGGRRLKVVALKGEDKVVQRVIHECWGQELSSNSVSTQPARILLPHVRF